MFKRILYIPSDKKAEKEKVKHLARAGGATVLLSGIFHTTTTCDKLTDGKTYHQGLREDNERTCWAELYDLEDEFKAEGIRSSVLVQQGDIRELPTLAHNIGADLIVISLSSLSDQQYRLPDEFLVRLPCPIIITNAD